MVEYGRTTGQSTGATGGGGGSFSISGDDIISVFKDLIDQVASLPVEVMVLGVGAIIAGGVFMTLRAS